MAELENIFHVDDDEDILDITLMSLEIVDSFTVRQFSSGQKALDAVTSIAPDLLLLDVMMPSMTGPDLWEAIKKLPGCENIPTIFMTAKAENSLSQELIELGALAVITKPFDPMTLGAVIRAAWAGL